MGFRCAISYFAGSIVAFGIVGPLLVYFNILNDAWGFSDPIYNPSAQYWLLWPGIIFMTVSSFIGVFFTINYKSLLSFFKDLIKTSLNRIGIKFPTNNIENESPIELEEFPNENEDEIEEINENKDEININNEIKVNNEEENDENIIYDNEIDDKNDDFQKNNVPTWSWAGGILISSIFTLFVLIIFFHILWYEIIIALVLSFLLSLVAVHVTGETDINPIGPVAHVIQIFFAFIAPHNPTSNVIAGNICAASSAQSVDMLTDLKTGYELKVNPQSQFIVQGIGSMAGVFSAVITFQIMITAYPCLLSLETIGNCKFTAPSASAWYGFTLALTSDWDSIDNIFPPYCILSMIIATIISIIIPILEYYLPESKHKYLPSPSSFGLAFITIPYISGAMFMGAVFLIIWEKIHKPSKEKYAYGVASGVSAGEGVAGVLVALLAIVNLNFEWCLLMPSTGEFSCT